MYNAVESAIDKCAVLCRADCRLDPHSSLPLQHDPGPRIAGRAQGKVTPADTVGISGSLHAAGVWSAEEELLRWYRDRGLVGSLFWRWDVQVYAGSGVADYGVRQFDSTFGARPAPARGQRQTDASTPAVNPQRPCTPCCQQARCSNYVQNWCSSDEGHRIVADAGCRALGHTADRVVSPRRRHHRGARAEGAVAGERAAAAAGVPPGLLGAAEEQLAAPRVRLTLGALVADKELEFAW